MSLREKTIDQHCSMCRHWHHAPEPMELWSGYGDCDGFPEHPISARKWTDGQTCLNFEAVDEKRYNG
jgi:hypothetical protein